MIMTFHTGCKSLLQEAVDERKRLEGETEQLKQLLKREIDKFDTEIATKNNVIEEYKTICSQLSEKLEKAQVWSLSGFRLSCALCARATSVKKNLNQVSSASLLMTSSAASNVFCELTLRPLIQAVSLSFAKTTKESGCSQVKKAKTLPNVHKILAFSTGYNLVSR